VISGAPPEAIDPTLTPNALADELAIWVLRDEARVSAKIKLGAASYLWHVIGRADRQLDAYKVLEPILGGQEAHDVVQLLRRHRVVAELGLIRAGVAAGKSLRSIGSELDPPLASNQVKRRIDTGERLGL